MHHSLYLSSNVPSKYMNKTIVYEYNDKILKSHLITLNPTRYPRINRFAEINKILSGDIVSLPHPTQSQIDRFNYVQSCHIEFPSLMSSVSYVSSIPFRRQQLIIDLLILCYRIPCSLTTFVNTISYFDRYIAICEIRHIPIDNYTIIGYICLMIARKEYELNCLCRACEQYNIDVHHITNMEHFNNDCQCICVIMSALQLRTQTGHVMDGDNTNISMEYITKLYKQIETILNKQYHLPSVITHLDALIPIVFPGMSNDMIHRTWMDTWIICSIMDPMCSIYLKPYEWAIAILTGICSYDIALKKYITPLNQYNYHITKHMEYQSNLFNCFETFWIQPDIKRKYLLRQFVIQPTPNECIQIDHTMFENVFKKNLIN
jgi:hypothetical protein